MRDMECREGGRAVVENPLLSPLPPPMGSLLGSGGHGPWAFRVPGTGCFCDPCFAQRPVICGRREEALKKQEST